MDRKRKQLPGRELIGAVLLAVLLLGGIGSSLWLRRHHEGLAENMADAAWYALSRDWDRAGQTTAKAMEDWQHRWKLCAVFLDEELMARIDVGFAQLSVYAAQRDTGQYAAVCRELAQELQIIADAHRFGWWGLL